MTSKASNEQEQGIDKKLLDACIHCGLCLPACPTYLATGREMESPRGRIYLLGLVESGQEELSPRLMEHIDSCLGCFGCQTACPSGVNYEAILNQARPAIAARKKDGAVRALLRFVFERILPDDGKLRIMGSMLALWQKLNLSGTLRAFSAGNKEDENSLKQVLRKLSEWESLMPQVPPHQVLPKKSWKAGKKTGTVQLFKGCVMDVFYNNVNNACIRLLTKQGNIVAVPEQTCCGALAYHAGEADITTKLARRNIEAFERTEGTIAVTAAGCGAMLKEYKDLFADDKAMQERALKFSERVVDITESLAANEFNAAPPAAKAMQQKRRVAYHAACHLAHAQNVRLEPQKLLQDAQSAVNAVLPGAIQLTPLAEAEHCCGSAGIYNLLHTELSLQVLERKMANIAASGADLVVTTNPGCQLQLQAGVRDKGLNVKVMHLCQFLDEIYCPGEE